MLTFLQKLSTENLVLEVQSNIIRLMIKIEKMERGTPEFRSLKPFEKITRRKLLAESLRGIMYRRDSGNIDQESATRMVAELLELHLTGRVESIPIKKKE